jgi:hypothetical protein
MCAVRVFLLEIRMVLIADVEARAGETGTTHLDRAILSPLEPVRAVSLSRYQLRR